MIKKTNDDFIKEMKIKNNKVTVIGEYIGFDKKVLVKCNECGNMFYSLPGALLKGHGCKKCATQKNAERCRMSNEDFRMRIKQLNSQLEVVGEYINNNTPIECHCLKCGNVFTPRPANLLNRKASCPKCSRLGLRKTQEEFVDDVKNVNPHVTILGEYVTNQDRVLCECDICGYKWSPRATWLLQGKGCPHCKMSKGEKLIEAFLIKNNIEYQTQFSFDGCKDKKNLPFDFYLPKYNLCIEFDGIQHFKQIAGWDFELTKHHDKIKNNFCCENHINLLRIKYTKIKKIDKILTDYLL